MNIPNLWRTRLQRYRLCSTYCVLCGAVFFPPRAICSCGCRLIVPLLVRAATADLLLEKTSKPVYTDFEWQQPYALPLLQTHTTGSLSQ